MLNKVREGLRRCYTDDDGKFDAGRFRGSVTIFNCFCFFCVVVGLVGGVVFGVEALALVSLVGLVGFVGGVVLVLVDLVVGLVGLVGLVVNRKDEIRAGSKRVVAMIQRLVSKIVSRGQSQPKPAKPRRPLSDAMLDLCALLLPKKHRESTIALAEEDILRRYQNLPKALKWVAVLGQIAFVLRVGIMLWVKTIPEMLGIVTLIEKLTGK